MRQIYTSARSENVDRVVQLMAEAGIQTTVTNRSNYAGHDYKGPSYTARSDRNSWAQVWVVHSEDQIRARAMLREIGIEPPTRFAEELSQSRGAAPTPQQRRVSFVWKVRTLVLGVLALVLLLNYLGVLHLF